MKLLSIAIAVLMANTIAVGQGVVAPIGQPERTSYIASECNEKLVLDILRPWLKASGYAARISFAGQCAANGDDFVCFPVVKIQQPIGSGYQAIESLFRGDANVTVTMKPGKLVSIIIGPVPTAILQTKVPVFTLSPLGQYNASLAINGLVNTPAMEGAATRLGLRYPLIPFNLFLTQPANGLPHLPDAVDGMTADEILDSIAVTFRGIVVYGISENPNDRIYTVDFVGVE